MGFELIDRMIKMTLIFAICVSLGMIPFTSPFECLGVFLSASWGSINLLFIKYLIKNLFQAEDRKILRILSILGVKFPLLYLAGYGLLAFDYFSFYSIISGFSLSIFLLLINGLRLIRTRSALFLLAISTTVSLHASLEGEVPEVPNIFTLLYKFYQDSPWAAFLHHWEGMIFSILLAGVISFVFCIGYRKNAYVPSSFQNGIEWIVETIRNRLVEILGPEGEKFVPFLGTLFIYILTMNWLVLIPLMKSPSSNFNITAALAICVFVLVQYLNIRNYGFFGFIYHLAGSPKRTFDWLLVPLIFPIELLTQMTRPLTLALRLFGNVVGEDILIGVFALFGVALFAATQWPIGFPLQIPFMFFAMLTGLMQALVFTLLSTIYILLSIPHQEENPAA